MLLLVFLFLDYFVELALTQRMVSFWFLLRCRSRQRSNGQSTELAHRVG
jgi:hypothetical protein